MRQMHKNCMIRQLATSRLADTKYILFFICEKNLTLLDSSTVP